MRTWGAQLMLGVLTACLALPAGAAQDRPMTRPSEGSGHLNVPGGRLHYEIAGSGPVLVLLHDGILHSEVWDAQWREFTQRYRVVRYDRRGYGRSDAPTASYSNLADLEALLAGLNIDRATLIGSSSGGELAVQFAAAHPEKVDALVLVGAVLSPLGFSTHFIQRENANAGASLSEMAEHWVKDPYLIATGNDAARMRAAELLKACPADLDNAKFEYQEPPAPAVVARWRDIRVPVLILVGASDIPDVHAHAGALEAGLVGAQRVVLPGAGHLPYLEQPEAFNRSVQDFLALIARRLTAPGRVPDFESGYAPVEGTALYYEVQGRGEPLVLIHGGSLDHRMWDNQFDAFTQRYRVIRYDVRGHGLSKGPPGTHRDHEDLRQLLAHLGIGRAHIAGLSLGGRIALDFALEHPDMVGCLIPVGPGLSGYKFEGADLAEHMKRLREAFVAGDYDQARELVQCAWTDGPQRRPEQVDPPVRSAVREMLNWGMVPGRSLSLPLPPASWRTPSSRIGGPASRSASPRKRCSRPIPTCWPRCRGS